MLSNTKAAIQHYLDESFVALRSVVRRDCDGVPLYGISILPVGVSRIGPVLVFIFWESPYNAGSGGIVVVSGGVGLLVVSTGC